MGRYISWVVSQPTGKARLNATDTVVNYGILEKSKIKSTGHAPNSSHTGCLGYVWFLSLFCQESRNQRKVNLPALAQVFKAKKTIHRRSLEVLKGDQRDLSREPYRPALLLGSHPLLLAHHSP